MLPTPPVRGAQVLTGPTPVASFACCLQPQRDRREPPDTRSALRFCLEAEGPSQPRPSAIPVIRTPVLAVPQHLALRASQNNPARAPPGIPVSWSRAWAWVCFQELLDDSSVKFGLRTTVFSSFQFFYVSTWLFFLFFYLICSEIRKDSAFCS